MALIPVTLAQILPREPTNKALQLDVILIRVVLVPKGGELIDYDPCDDIDHDFHHQYLLQVIKGPSRIVNVLKVGRIRVTKKSPNRPSFLKRVIKNSNHAATKTNTPLLFAPRVITCILVTKVEIITELHVGPYGEVVLKNNEHH